MLPFIVTPQHNIKPSLLSLHAEAYETMVADMRVVCGNIELAKAAAATPGRTSKQYCTAVAALSICSIPLSPVRLLVLCSHDEV